MRRPWVVLVALAALMLAAAPAAYAQEPTITTDITFPEEGEPFGTFTATRAAVSIGDIRGRVRRWRRSIYERQVFLQRLHGSQALHL